MPSAAGSVHERRRMPAYEEQRRRHVAYMTARAPEYVARLGWSRARIEEERTRALRVLLRHAIARSPWHRDRLGGVDVDRFTPDRIAELPTMTKADLMAHWDRIVTVPVGRTDDVFEYAGGVRVHPHDFRTVLAGSAAVTEYQVRPTPRGADVDVVSHADLDAALSTTLASRLEALGLGGAAVTVRRVDAIPRQATGKLKRFVPLA